jgi:glycolate oxidase
MNRWISPLKRLFPPGLVSTDPKVLDAHAGDAWFAASLPEAVFFADTTASVSRLMRFAFRHRIPVTARGAGRGYVGGCVPRKGGIVVSFARMNRIKEISAADFVAVVEPGVITGRLQKAVLKRGLFYPPDPASSDECSLGGNVATNAGGPRCLKYGVTRNYILGLTIVLADGSVVRTGGRTHKNKSGFDLVGLFTGAEGLLGLVTEITLRLIPHPPARAGLSASFSTARAAANAVGKIFAAGFLPCALEMADRFTLEAARRHIGPAFVPPGNAHLLLEIDGQPASVRNEIREILRLVRSCGALDLRTAANDAACTQLWSLRRQFSASLKSTGLTKLNEDVTVPRGRLVDLFQFAEQLQKQFRVPVACFGHAGDGNIHVNLMVDENDPSMRRRADKALDVLFKKIIAWEGAITGEHGIGLAKLPWWPLAASSELRTLHRQIKKAVDPRAILNPGKFV